MAGCDGHVSGTSFGNWFALCGKIAFLRQCALIMKFNDAQLRSLFILLAECHLIVRENLAQR
jgi:hypothetical protein